MKALFDRIKLKKAWCIIGAVAVAIVLLGAIFLRGNNTVRIDSAGAFENFARNAAKGQKYYEAYAELTADIDLSSSRFAPIESFNGVFNGNGHSIKGLSIATDSDAGLFLTLDGKVFNLVIESGRIEGKNNCGAVAAVLQPNGIVANVLSYAAVCTDDGRAGAIVGMCYGSLLNCADMIDRDADGEQHITSNEAMGRIENCYTYNGGQFEIICNGTDDNRAAIKRRAVRNLNNRLFELSREFEQVEFCRWEQLDKFPHLKLTQNVADPVVSIRMDDNELEYSFGKHMYIVDGGVKNLSLAEFSYKTFKGNEGRVCCERDADEIHFWVDDIETVVGFNKKEKLSDSDEKVVIDFDNIKAVDSKSVSTRRIVYLGEPDVGDSDELRVALKKGNDYVLRGKLSGYIVSDVSDDKKHGLSIELDGVDIESAHGPAIWAINEGKNENSGLSVFLADGKNNTITASNYMDIFSAGEKAEGAISAGTSVNLYGNTGSLKVEADLEGIEGATNIVVNGGNYYFNTMDDSIACKGMLLMRKGKLILNAYDNAVDCDDIYVVGGLIAGSALHIKESFMKSNARIDGGTVAYAGKMHRLHPNSIQPYIEHLFDDKVKAGKYVVALDSKKRPIVAIKLLEETDSAFFSSPSAAGAEYIACDWVDGKFEENVCTDVVNYK